MISPSQDSLRDLFLFSIEPTGEVKTAKNKNQKRQYKNLKKPALDIA